MKLDKEDKLRYASASRYKNKENNTSMHDYEAKNND